MPFPATATMERNMLDYSICIWVKRSQKMNRKVVFIILLAFTWVLSIYAVETRAIETFPYSENFNSVSIPNLPAEWTVEDSNHDGITWETDVNLDNPSDYGAMCTWNDYIAMDDWLFTPSLHLLNDKSYRIKFSFKGQDVNYVEKLEVKTGTGPSSAYMNPYPIYYNLEIMFDEYMQVTNILTITPKGEGERSYYNIGFHGISGPFQWNLWIDNFSIEEIPNIPVFHSNLASYDFGNHQIRLNSQPISFEVENLGLAELNLTSCSLIGTNASDFVLLDSNNYPVQLFETDFINVSINFLPQTVGSKSVVLRFIENGTIAHDIPITGIGIDNTITTYPFSQNFETVQLPTGWIKYADGAGWRFGNDMPWGGGIFSIPPHTNYAAVDKFTARWEFDNLPGRNDYLIPPPFNLAVGDGIPHLTFNSYFTGCGGEQAHVEYSTDGTNWNTIYAMSPSITWTQAPIDINLNAFISCSRFFIRFHADDMGFEYATGWAIDDIKLEFLPYTPTNIQFTRTLTTVHLTWDPVQNVNGYSVYSSPDPYSDLWTLETPIPIIQTSWTGNTNQPRKYFRVKSVRN
jgi:hypothetical protein